MNSLDDLLVCERTAKHAWRTHLCSAAGGPSTSLSRLAARLIWPRQFRHMRYLAPGIIMQNGKDRNVSIYKHGHLLKKCLPLTELIPGISQPTSIIATGPSALDYSWDEFRNGERFLIAVNGAPTMLQKIGITPHLLVVTDREFALSGAKHFAAAPGTPLAIEFLAAAALAFTAPQFLLDRPVAIIERVNMWYGLPALNKQTLTRMNEESGQPFFLPAIADPACRIGWSYRPELGVFSSRNVVFSSLQIAIGLGALDLEIIGMDLGGSGRSYTEGQDKRPTQLQEHYESYILPSFQIMHKALTGRRVKVANLSPVCPLPAEIFTAATPED